MPNTTPFLRTHQSPRADPQSWEHSCRMIQYSLLVWGIHPRSGRLSRGCRRAEALLCQLHWQCIRGRVCPEISGSYRPNVGWDIQCESRGGPHSSKSTLPDYGRLSGGNLGEYVRLHWLTHRVEKIDGHPVTKGEYDSEEYAGTG